MPIKGAASVNDNSGLNTFLFLIQTTTLQGFHDVPSLTFKGYLTNHGRCDLQGRMGFLWAKHQARGFPCEKVF
jgi:hypothetical protein